MQPEARQSRLVDPILMELDQEAATTKKLLEIIPEDKLSWRPHRKGKIAGRIRDASCNASRRSCGDSASRTERRSPIFRRISRRPAGHKYLKSFAESLKKAKDIVSSTDDARAMAEWNLTKAVKPFIAMPRIGFWRAILLNHNYHHRGQLSTYLRQLDVPAAVDLRPERGYDPFALEA